MLTFITFNVSAQMNNYKIYAGFVNHFTKYVQYSNIDGDFIIGVLGDSPIYGELSMLNGKMVGNQKIVVKRINNISEILNFKIIFVSDSKVSNIVEINKKAKTNKTMIITETNGAIQKGSDINFILKNDKINFEIGVNNNEQHGLKISNELKKLGIVVE